MKITNRTKRMLNTFCVGAVGAALLAACSDKAQVQASKPVETKPAIHQLTAITVSPTLPELVYAPAHGLAATDRYNLALDWLNKGDADKAEIELIQVCGEWPTFSKPFKNLARAQLKLGKPKDALAHALKATELNPTDGTIDNVIGMAHMDLGEHDSAVAAYRMAITKSPEFVWAYNNLGYLHIFKGRFDDAKMVLEEGAKLSGAPAVLFNNLGVALETTGDPHGALEAFRAAASLQPGNAKAAASIARLEPMVDETEADQSIAQIPVTSDTPSSRNAE